MDYNLNSTFVSIDFETADYQADSACAIGMAKIEQGEIVDTFYSLIRPPRSLVYFTHIHGLTWNMLKASSNFAGLWENISAFFADADYFIAHNASFDKRVLEHCCLKASLAKPELPFICTLKESRKRLKLKSHNLGALCAYYDIDFVHHHAGEDAVAAAKLFLKICGD